MPQTHPPVRGGPTMAHGPHLAHYWCLHGPLAKSSFYIFIKKIKRIVFCVPCENDMKLQVKCSLIKTSEHSHTHSCVRILSVAAFVLQWQTESL